MFLKVVFFSSFFYKNAFLTFCCFLLEETLKVQRSTKLMMVFLNTDASVLCLISEYSTPQLSNNIRITWYLKTQDNDQENMLFTFIAGNHSPPRVGSYMLDSEIKKAILYYFCQKYSWRKQDYTDINSLSLLMLLKEQLLRRQLVSCFILALFPRNSRSKNCM